MFWQSIYNTLELYLNYHIYLVIFEYSIITIFLNILFSKFEFQSKSNNNVVLTLLGKYFSKYYFPTLITFLSVFIFYSTLHPILFGLSKDIFWLFPFTLFLKTKAFIFIIIISFILSFLFPLFKIHAIIRYNTFGIFSISFLYFFAYKITNSGDINNISFFPGYDYMAGFMFLGTLISLVIFGTFYYLLNYYFYPKTNLKDNKFILNIVDSFSFIPILFYGSWLGMQI